MGLLLSFTTVVKTLVLVFVERLQLHIIYPGLILAVLGLAFAFLAKRITRVVRKTNDINENDRVFLGLKATGLVLIFFAMIFLIVQLSI